MENKKEGKVGLLIQKIKSILQQVKKNSLQKKAMKKEELKQTARVADKRKKKYLESLERNPYLQSRALWNDMYGDIQAKLENSYKIIFILSGVVFLSIIGFIIVSGETKIKPMPFVIHGNEVFALSEDNSIAAEAVKPKMALYFAQQFVRDSRSVSVDGSVNNQNRISALSYVSGAAAPVLNQYYMRNNPSRIAQTAVKDVNITSILRLSKNTLEVRWQEVWRDASSGKESKTESFIGQMTYTYGEPSGNEAILKNNPMGFDITQLSWTKNNLGA